MMIKPENKMQQAAGNQSAACPDCKGKGNMIAKCDGKLVSCYRCRGTGVDRGGYSTK
jgi:DnaJ-class molecular chaperone